MAAEVYANSMGVAHKGGGGKAQTPADVLKTPTPGGPAPLPYPGLGNASDLADGIASVHIAGTDVMVQKSKISRITGGEAGTLGGVMSGSCCAAANPLMGAQSVRAVNDCMVLNFTTFSLNDSNTVGMYMQSQGVAPVAKVQPGEKETWLCNVCGEALHDSPQAKPAGDAYKNAGQYRICVMKNYGSETTRFHPLFILLKKISRLTKTTKNSDADSTHAYEICDRSLIADAEIKSPYHTTTVQVHHIICGSAIKQDFWPPLCMQFGYNINGKHNLVTLPGKEQVACALRLPLHKGNHNEGWTYDKSGNKITKQGAHTGGKAVDLNYVDAVKQRIANITQEALKGGYCDEIGQFSEAMYEASKEICKHILDFTWTLNKTGRDYMPGGKGCGLLEVAGDRCREHPDFVAYFEPFTFKPGIGL